MAIREGRIPDSKETDVDDLAIHFALYVRDLLPSLIGAGDAQKQLRVTTTLTTTCRSKPMQPQVEPG